MTLLTIGCGGGGESGLSTGDNQTKDTEACPGSRQPTSRACVAQNPPQRSEPGTTVRSTADPELQGSGPKSIPGMNVKAALTTLQKPGLECWQSVDRGILHACSGDENPDLLYEASITGGGSYEVSGLEARVLWQGNGDGELASQPFFGLLSTQLRYRGANSNKAFAFVNRSLSSSKATTTIGAARWTITTADNSKRLTLTPA